ncbi:MAG TPA: hypothetical protein VKV74_17275 [Bryobacteraceae bacterium]|nr:hypothetical protein [Bryobacteraceae bacterium]
MTGFSLCRLAAVVVSPLTLCAQANSRSATEDKRILGIFTNHRTAEESAALTPLTPRGKLAIAWEDTTDPAIFAQSAFLAGIGQAVDSNPSFRQGMGGYAKRFGAAYADFSVQNFMTEGLFPVMLHQDPRYFRRHKGSGPSRLAYAAGRLFVTRTDSGQRQFNYSEVAGGAASLAVSDFYHPDGRNLGDNMQRYALQLGFDAASNVLKEFWPDLKRKLPRKLAPQPQP